MTSSKDAGVSKLEMIMEWVKVMMGVGKKTQSQGRSEELELKGLGD